MSDSNALIGDCERRMTRTLEVLQQDLGSIRTGRASPSLLDKVQVEAWGSTQPIQSVASISVPEPRQIVIKPFDASQIQEVAKAIQASDLGINPNVDGKILRLNIPPLSEERRKKLVALVKEKAEAARVSIRNVRRDGNKHADAAIKELDHA